MTRSADDRRDALARGAAAETRVADALEASGWQVLARNWRGGGGELDIIAEKDGCVRFVEVKGRSETDLDPFEQIDASKQRKLRRAARAWLAHRDVEREVAFLVAIVSFDEGWSVEWIDDAFGG